MSYCDADFADAYFSKRAFAEKWSGDAETKAKYLETASGMIRDYCTFEDDDGVFVYDETDQGKHPVEAWLKRATCEQALHLLNLGKDPTQADKKTTLGIVRADDGTTFDKSFAADVLCMTCRMILESNGGMIADDTTAGDSGASSGRWLK